MTPQRFLECLAYLFWTRETLAEVLECDPALINAWATGREEIPAGLAAWLETLAKAHEAAGVPTTYRKARFSAELWRARGEDDE